jgi:hypothetical protein
MARVHVKVSITYGQKVENTKEKLNVSTVSQGKTSSSRTPDQNKEYKQHLQLVTKTKPKIENMHTEKYRSITEDTNDLLRVIRGKQPVKNQIKNGSSNGLQNQNLLNSDKKENVDNANNENNHEEAKLEVVVERNTDTSMIDEIFTDERADLFEQPINNLTALIERLHSTFTEHYFESLTDAEDALKKEANNMIQELFNLQENYYKSFNDSLNLNQKLREFLVKYGTKYRLINKKNNKLKERIESNNLKSNLTTMVNREENDRIKDIITLNKQELNTYKDIFHINYNDSDLKKFKEETATRNEEKDKQSLLRTAEIIFKNPENLKKLSEEKRILLENLLRKYEIKLEQTQPILMKNTSSEETKDDLQPEYVAYENNEGYQNNNTQPQESNKIEFSDNEEDELPENNIINTDEPIKNNYEEVGTKTNDQVDQKLNTFLNDFYAKKRVSQIPFRRVSQGNYEFGTQKVLVKVDNEKIKVRVGGGYLLLDKFIEMNAPVEEAKLMNAKNISGKFSKNVNVKKVTGGKAIYSLESANSNRNNKTPDKKIVTSI